MAYIEFDPEDIKPGVVFVSKKELMIRTGIPKSTLYRHIKTDKLDAFQFRNRTYFYPEEADKYAAMVSSGILGK